MTEPTPLERPEEAKDTGEGTVIVEVTPQPAPPIPAEPGEDPAG